MSELDAIAGLMLTGVAPGRHAPSLRWRRQGEAYADRRQQAAVVQWQDLAADLSFRVPRDGSADFVMLSAASTPGRYRVSNVQAGGVAIVDLPSRIMAVDGGRPAAGAVSIVVDNALSPPRLELDARGLDVGSLQLRVERERDADGRNAIVGAIDDVARAQAGAEARLRETQLSLGTRTTALEHALVAVQAFLADAIDVEGKRVDAVIGESIDRLAVDVCAQFAGYMDRVEAANSRRDARADELREDFARIEALLREIAEVQVRQSSEIQAQDAMLVRIVNGIENVFWRRWTARLRKLAQ